ncbi:MAG TPA: hypothetical protein VFE50_23375 [Cyclobacteriaceae bacterium]|nr:hypothetical protein [Cyclobacteriaceae bacterium]
MKLEGDIDELVFDYLEGNLDKEEQEAFNLLKEENETFNHNVRLWQNAYISEGLPETGDLEQRLMIGRQPGTGIMSKVGLVTIIVGLLSFVPSSINEKLPEFRPLQEEPPVAVIVTEPTPVRKTNRKEFKEQKEQIVEPSPSSGMIEVSEVQVVDLWKTVPVTLPSVTIKALELRLVTERVPAYTDRDINRLKRRQLERRRAGEFKAGNIPYVVPLSSKNF